MLKTIQDIPFEQLINKQECNQAFCAYLATKHNTEMMDFINDYIECTLSVTDMIEKYVKVGAKKELNIPQKLRSTVLNSDQKDYTVFEELFKEIKLLLKTSCYPAFKTNPEYKDLLANYYPKSGVMETLKCIDFSEWNAVQVYLYMRYNSMEYILQNRKLLGTVENVTGSRLFMFIEEEMNQHGDLIKKEHMSKLQALLDTPPTFVETSSQETRRRNVTFKCLYRNKHYTVLVEDFDRIIHSELGLSYLKLEICREIEIDSVASLKMRDSDGDYISVKDQPNLKYILLNNGLNAKEYYVHVNI
jgi:hypothetical protein